MKRQLNPRIKAHLLPTLFILLSLVAICAIPFTLAQQGSKKNLTNYAVAGEMPAVQSADGVFDGTQAAPNLPSGGICQYIIAQIGGSIVAGTTDVGNHGDDQVTTVALPFSYTLYDQTYSAVSLSSNGNAQFTTTATDPLNSCLPWTSHNYTIFPYWSELYLVNPAYGIFTSVSGSAPNRIFNIEWRAQYFPGSGGANFELRLYEGQTRFDVIYGSVSGGNTFATAGVQKNDTNFQQYFCNGTGGSATGGQSYILSPCGTPTPMPTCTPGNWTYAAPVKEEHYGGFMDSDGTFGYEGGGYSFYYSDNIDDFGKFDPVANTWTPLAPVPDLNNCMASAVYAPNVNKLFVFGGERINSATVVDTTRIYDIATNTWSTGAPMPDVRTFMASGYYNGKIYLVGGYSTGSYAPAFLQTWEYDPVANTFATKTSIPASAGFGGAGSGVVNGHLYVAGGRDANNSVIATTWDYDIAADNWTTRSDLPAALNVPGSAVIGGKLWIFGGGNPHAGPGTMPTSANNGVTTWFNQLLYPDTSGALELYDPATNTWSSGPSLNHSRSYPASTHVGNTAVVVGGYSLSNPYITNSVETNSACSAPVVTGAVSRKIHGSNPFDITLPGIECRTTGGTNDYTMVVTFSGNVTVTGNPQAQLIAGTGCVGSAGVCTGNVSVSGAVVTVPLTNIINDQNIIVRILGVNGAADAPATDFDFHMSILIGDTNGNGTVNAADVAQTKGRLGQAVDGTNFRSDVNANGSINAGDTAIVKQHSGTSLPP